jgi:hypothetical protein
MISWTQAISDHAEAEAVAKALGLEYEKLTGWDATTEDAFVGSELDKWRRSFDRQFVIGVKEREIVDIWMRHRTEILMGAMVATKQFSKRFDGERPEAGKFGMLPIRAGYLGIGDDWDDVSAFTGGSLQNWIHSGTTLMGGTAGNAVKIGKNAVHIVIAIGDYHPAPKLESLQLTIDGKPKPGIYCGFAHRLSDFAIKELDVAFIFKYGTTVLGKVFQKQTGDSWPYPLGVSFIPENILREYVDVANLPGTVADVILTT